MEQFRDDEFNQTSFVDRIRGQLGVIGIGGLAALTHIRRQRRKDELSDHLIFQKTDQTVIDRYKAEYDSRIKGTMHYSEVADVLNRNESDIVVKIAGSDTNIRPGSLDRMMSSSSVGNHDFNIDNRADQIDETFLQSVHDMIAQKTTATEEELMEKTDSLKKQWLIDKIKQEENLVEDMKNKRHDNLLGESYLNQQKKHIDELTRITHQEHKATANGIINVKTGIVTPYQWGGLRLNDGQLAGEVIELENGKRVNTLGARYTDNSKGSIKMPKGVNPIDALYEHNNPGLVGTNSGGVQLWRLSKRVASNEFGGDHTRGSQVNAAASLWANQPEGLNSIGSIIDFDKITGEDTSHFNVNVGEVDDGGSKVKIPYADYGNDPGNTARLKTTILMGSTYNDGGAFVRVDGNISKLTAISSDGLSVPFQAYKLQSGPLKVLGTIATDDSLSARFGNIIGDQLRDSDVISVVEAKKWTQHPQAMGQSLLNNFDDFKDLEKAFKGILSSDDYKELLPSLRYMKQTFTDDNGFVNRNEVGQIIPNDKSVPNFVKNTTNVAHRDKLLLKHVRHTSAVGGTFFRHFGDVVDKPNVETPFDNMMIRDGEGRIVGVSYVADTTILGVSSETKSSGVINPWYGIQGDGDGIKISDSAGVYLPESFAEQANRTRNLNVANRHTAYSTMKIMEQRPANKNYMPITKNYGVNAKNKNANMSLINKFKELHDIMLTVSNVDAETGTLKIDGMSTEELGTFIMDYSKKIEDIKEQLNGDGIMLDVGDLDPGGNVSKRYIEDKKSNSTIGGLLGRKQVYFDTDALFNHNVIGSDGKVQIPAPIKNFVQVVSQADQKLSQIISPLTSLVDEAINESVGKLGVYHDSGRTAGVVGTIVDGSSYKDMVKATLRTSQEEIYGDRDNIIQDMFSKYDDTQKEKLRNTTEFNWDDQEADELRHNNRREFIMRVTDELEANYTDDLELGVNEFRVNSQRYRNMYKHTADGRVWNAGVFDGVHKTEATAIREPSIGTSASASANIVSKPVLSKDYIQDSVLSARDKLQTVLYDDYISHYPDLDMDSEYGQTTIKDATAFSKKQTEQITGISYKSGTQKTKHIRNMTDVIGGIYESNAPDQLGAGPNTINKADFDKDMIGLSIQYTPYDEMKAMYSEMESFDGDITSELLESDTEMGQTYRESKELIKRYERLALKNEDHVGNITNMVDAYDEISEYIHDKRQEKLAEKLESELQDELISTPYDRKAKDIDVDQRRLSNTRTVRKLKQRKNKGRSKSIVVETIDNLNALSNVEQYKNANAHLNYTIDLALDAKAEHRREFTISRLVIEDSTTQKKTLYNHVMSKKYELLDRSADPWADVKLTKMDDVGLLNELGLPQIDGINYHVAENIPSDGGFIEDVDYDYESAGVEHIKNSKLSDEDRLSIINSKRSSIMAAKQSMPNTFNTAYDAMWTHKQFGDLSVSDEYAATSVDKTATRVAQASLDTKLSTTSTTITLDTSLDFKDNFLEIVNPHLPKDRHDMAVERFITGDYAPSNESMRHAVDRIFESSDIKQELIDGGISTDVAKDEIMKVYMDEPGVEKVPLSSTQIQAHIKKTADVYSDQTQLNKGLKNLGEALNSKQQQSTPVEAIYDASPQLKMMDSLSKEQLQNEQSKAIRGHFERNKLSSGQWSLLQNNKHRTAANAEQSLQAIISAQSASPMSEKSQKTPWKMMESENRIVDILERPRNANKLLGHSTRNMIKGSSKSISRGKVGAGVAVAGYLTMKAMFDMNAGGMYGRDAVGHDNFAKHRDEIGEEEIKLQNIKRQKSQYRMLSNRPIFVDRYNGSDPNQVYNIGRGY